MPRQKANPIELSREEWDELKRVAASRTVAHRAAQRAKLVLLSAGGNGDQAIATQLGLSISTVFRWRSRFSAERLEGLKERPRQGRPRRYTEADRARVISTACTEKPPDGTTHWTVRSLSAHTGVGRDAVHRILRAERLAPHRVKSWVTSNVPELKTVTTS